MTTSFSPMISQDQIAQFDRDGGVTFDGPFSEEQIEAASRLCGELDDKGQLGGPNDYRLEREFVEILQNPFLEEAAKRVLRCDDVEFWELAVRQNKPQVEEGGMGDAGVRMMFEHVDINFTLEELDSIPRRFAICFMVWLTDVTMDRGPFMYRPGSHRQIARHIEGQTFPPGTHMIGNGMPALKYAELVPALATKGQITLQTSSVIHGPAVNTGRLPRRVMFVSYAPRGFSVDIPQVKPEVRWEWHRKLRGVVDAERRHILADC